MLELINGIVLTIGEAGNGVLGRTAIQKLLYFSTVKGIVDATYYAHFYGPYSEDVTASLSTLISFGFVEERMEITSGEQRRYRYSLTANGRKLLDEIKSQQPQEEISKIEKIVKQAKEYSSDLGAVDLSIPAKSHFILREAREPMTLSAISEAAKRLGWDVPPEQITKSIEFLENLGLVTVQAPK